MGYYIDSKLVQWLGLKTHNLARPITVYNVDHTENIAGKIRTEVEFSFSTFGRTMRATFLVTTLGQQAIILGLPWLEVENPDIDWARKTLRWRKPEEEHRNIYALFQSYEPTDDLVISFIQGKMTDEARDTWNDTRMNKAMLFAYQQDKEKLDAMKKKPLKELVPKEFHKFLKVFSDNEACSTHSLMKTWRKDILGSLKTTYPKQLDSFSSLKRMERFDQFKTTATSTNTRSKMHTHSLELTNSLIACPE